MSLNAFIARGVAIATLAASCVLGAPQHDSPANSTPGGAPVSTDPAPQGDCTADANGDGQLSVLDFVAFQSLFTSGDPGADVNGDGVLNLLDLIAFQQAYTNGCDEGFAWTDLEPSPDTRFVYVSSSNGNDSNDGLSPAFPVKTIAKGAELVRDGYPDWLLFKRGDVWTDQIFGRWKKSGRSKSEPLLIGAYGNASARPLFKTGKETRALWLDGAAGVQHVAVVGIELYAHAYTGSDGAEAGILWLGDGGDVLIEDCLVRGYKDNIVIQGFGGIATDIRVRGCVVLDAYSTIAHAQGLYAQEASDILIEGCVFDHNGWAAGIPGAEPNIFNHNVYIQTSCNDVDVRDCLIMNASSHGVQMRCTGTVEDSLFIVNPIGLLVGNGGETPPVTTTISDNAFLFANDINPDNPRGMGLDLANIGNAQIVHNIFALETSLEPHGYAMKMHANPDAPVDDVVFASNIVFEMRGGLRFTATSIDGVSILANTIHVSEPTGSIIKHDDNPLSIGIDYTLNHYYSGAPDYKWFQVASNVYDFDAWTSLVGEAGAKNQPASFVNPYRTPESYQTSIGEEPSMQAFINAVRKQGRLTWDPRYANSEILGYFQDGFAPAP